MARSKALRTRPADHGPVGIRQARGQHRLGRPGLSHCRDLPEVHARLSAGKATRHAPSASRAHLNAKVAVAVLVAAITTTVAVGGWYADAAASVIASLVTP